MTTYVALVAREASSPKNMGLNFTAAEERCNSVGAAEKAFPSEEKVTSPQEQLTALAQNGGNVVALVAREASSPKNMGLCYTVAEESVSAPTLIMDSSSSGLDQGACAYADENKNGRSNQKHRGNGG